MMCAVNQRDLKVEFFNNFMDNVALTNGNYLQCTIAVTHILFSSSSVEGLPC